MKKKLLTGLVTGMFMFAMAGMANATIINVSLDEYSSPILLGEDIPTEYTIGTFIFDLLGETVVSAVIYGSWGNSENPTSASNFLELDGVEVANTYNYTPDPIVTDYVSWIYTFSDFSIFTDGSAVFNVTQTYAGAVRLNNTYLTIETAPVPEPTTMLLLGTGLVCLVGTRIRKKQKQHQA